MPNASTCIHPQPSPRLCANKRELVRQSSWRMNKVSVYCPFQMSFGRPEQSPWQRPPATYGPVLYDSQFAPYGMLRNHLFRVLQKMSHRSILNGVSYAQECAWETGIRRG